MLYFVDEYQPLYQDVQSSGLFNDSKFFPDCNPKRNPQDILSDYISQKTNQSFSLLDFLVQNFEFPPHSELDYSSAAKSINQHIATLWDYLTRPPIANSEQYSTLLSLPHSYIVPGGRFREVYYWDSYFTMLGLVVSDKKTLAHSMVKNFEWLIQTFGFVPNGNRSYYLSRSQPPFFALMVDLLYGQNMAKMKDFLPTLEIEYNFWMDTQSTRRIVHMPDGELLNRYWDDSPLPRPEAWLEDTHLATENLKKPADTWRQLRAAAESGWDFSTRWFENPLHFSSIQTTEIVPLDLNCLLYFLENTILNIHKYNENLEAASEFSARCENRKQAIQKYFWSEKEGFFFDFNLIKQEKCTSKTLAATYPLFFNLATTSQAQKTAQILETNFLKPGGFVTTLIHSGQQWDAPNGWPPLQWMAYKGLLNYNFDNLAAEARMRWITLNEQVYKTTGKMMEKYNVEDLSLTAGGGEYPNQDGFGWTNGVYLALKTS